jgi:hypothetical protein
LVSRSRRKSQDVGKAAIPRANPAFDVGPAPPSCPTAITAEALRTGVVPYAGRVVPARIPHEDETIRAGDPDDDVLANEYAGDDTPGGSSTTPDQNEVDSTGRAYGLQEEGSGSLRCASEILDRRDRHRSELIPPRRPV